MSLRLLPKNQIRELLIILATMYALGTLTTFVFETTAKHIRNAQK